MIQQATTRIERRTTARACHELKVLRSTQGVVFEYYDAQNLTDPTQTLRKPSHQDQGECVPGVMGLQGHCGSGGIREYNFCAGIALLWLRGGE